MTQTETRPVRRTAAKQMIIDCDIHNVMAPGALEPYLSNRWLRHLKTFGSRQHNGNVYPKGSPARYDAFPPSGLPAGADLGFMQKQHLDGLNVEFGILGPLSGSGSQLDPEFSAALSAATNDWQIKEWLEPEPRLRSGMIVPAEHSEQAVAEIERLAGHPGFVQVLLVARSSAPLGDRRYWKMYEAAARHDLPIGIHYGGGVRGVPISSAGWPSFYLEDHAGMSAAFQAHVASLILGGVFDRLPNLRIALIEGGFAWLPSLMWRLDQHWKRLHEEVPHLTRAPSEYIRDHFWLTTQPMEEPHNPKHLLDVFEHHGAPDKIMFSTDYPHWDFDAPDRAFPVSLPAAFRDDVFSGNAKALYELD
jgi:uncharacterized protein